ncbi:MAG: POTRA domain-containing protein, partial [Myxococcaceae bacterium]
MQPPLPRTWMLGLLLASGALGACAGPQRKNLPVVRSLEIIGTKEVDPGTIRSHILTNETSKWTGWLPEWAPFADRQYFEPPIWRMDLRRIERFYRAEGFYEAQVVDDAVTFRNERRDVDLRVTVEEGPPTQVSELEVAGLEALPPPHQKRALDEAPLQEGHRFREESWNALKTQ